MRPLLAALLALATSALPAAASEEPAAARARLTDLLPPAGVSSLPGDAGPLAEPGDLLPRAAHPAITSYLDAERALLERAWGTPVVDLRRAADDAEAEPGDDPSTPDGRLRVLMSSSDLNGDEHGDVPFFDIGLDEFGFWTDVSITAHDGRTGDRLWSREYGLPYNILVFSPGDLTGDGANDLLVLSIDRVLEFQDLVCQRPTFCSFNDTVTYEWGVTVVSGIDGSAAWERTIEGSVTTTGAYAGQGPGLTVYHHLDAVNGLVDIRPAGDLDGDGLGDLTLNMHDYFGDRAFRQNVWYESLTYTTRAEALTGDTGAVLLTRELEDRPGAALLLPAGEATGDARADLLWTEPTEANAPRVCTVEGCVDPSSMRLGVDLIDAATGESRWHADVDEESYRAAAPILTGRDLTGDGRADVVIGMQAADGTVRARMLSGADGAAAWTVDTLLTDPPTALGSIDGGAGDDLLLWEGWYPTAEEAPGVVFRIRLRRVDGASGQPLLTTQHDLTDPDPRLDTIFATPAGDVNGDGTPDIAHAVWHHSGWWEEDGSATAILRVESGADGSELLSLERDRKALLFPGGEWTAGSAAGLFEGSTPYNDTSFQLAAIQMPGGATLWTRSDVLFTAYFGVAGRPGPDDLVYSRTQVIEEAPRRLSRIDVLRGADAAPVWGVGPDLRA